MAGGGDVFASPSLAVGIGSCGLLGERRFENVEKFLFAGAVDAVAREGFLNFGEVGDEAYFENHAQGEGLGREAQGVSMSGEGVLKGVAGTVASLAGGADHSYDRRCHGEEVQGLVEGGLV